jgi:dihydrofolate reductase
MIGNQGGESGVDQDYAAAGIENLGSWILGRNMFSPSRGRWPDDGWKGWWGSNPPYHVPVFILTHHPRAPIVMEGGTLFISSPRASNAALERAVEAADGKDVRIGGGSETIRQYLQAGLIDEMHLAYNPVLLGNGEPLLEGLNLPEFGYRVTSHQASEKALHVMIAKSAG